MESVDKFLSELEPNESAKKMYVVYYTEGSYDDTIRRNLFVTEDYKMAIDYIGRFNSALRKCADYYGKLSDKYNSGELRVEEDAVVFDRILAFQDTNPCEIDEVEVR